MLVETDTNGSPVAYYVYGLGLAQRISGGTVSTYHFNNQGSTVALTDSAGNVTDSYAYDSFGTLRNSDGDSAQPFLYLGRYGIINDSTGLLYIRTRYYDPQLGRFITKDTAISRDSNDQSLNRYLYSEANPVALFDPTGFSAIYQNQFLLSLLSPTDLRSHVLLLNGNTLIPSQYQTAHSTPMTLAGGGGVSFGQILFVGGIVVQLAFAPETFELVPEEIALEGSADATEVASSRVLAGNLEDAAGTTRPADSAAHHIVAGADPRAAEARAILQREGIGINDSDNGVFLPKNTSVPNPTGALVHSTLHTGIYYDAVNAALRNAQPGTIGDTLQDIAGQLLNGTFSK
jgi:RHS repeat-associated protein